MIIFEDWYIFWINEEKTNYQKTPDDSFVLIRIKAQNIKMKLNLETNLLVPQLEPSEKTLMTWLYSFETPIALKSISLTQHVALAETFTISVVPMSKFGCLKFKEI